MADYDAAEALELPRDKLPAATRETAKCEACFQTRYGRRQTRPHSLVWGGVPQGAQTEFSEAGVSRGSPGTSLAGDFQQESFQEFLRVLDPTDP